MGSKEPNWETLVPSNHFVSPCLPFKVIGLRRVSVAEANLSAVVVEDFCKLVVRFGL